ncbi:hypothetical protein [Nocardia pseudovaccinii]|uniref:hypothetical protein n=1 Tax=Nocardia pseudovaccinii TaxID=189540 RepID=UPI0007A42C8C|nr:hypothetical protein [Nocardia pseudovaccinii]
MGKHANNRTHPAGSQRTTVSAITSRAESAMVATVPMTVVAEPLAPDQPDEWVTTDAWAHAHFGQVNR